LDSFSGCTSATYIPAAAALWRHAGPSLNDADGGSTPVESQVADSSSTAQCLSEAAAPVRFQILIVEDNRADVFLIREAIKQSRITSDLQFASDGEKAIEIIAAADADEDVSAPDLILLDLNLPRRSGSEVLKQIRLSRRCATTPVLIVSSSDSERDRADATRFGANGYFRKPSSYTGFMKLGAAVREILRLDSCGDEPGNRQ
jgi:chemotaxis family two-component system response regulator Rcp1